MKLAATLLALLILPGACLAKEREPGEGGAVAQRFLAATTLAQSFDCRNVSCKKLRSCAEACYKLTVCGQSIRDRDNDGIPCENLCSRPCPR